MQSDYVVVGTGSAGSVVASRLSADSRNQVVVLEAGPMDDDKFVHIPAAFSKLFRGPLDWDYLTEPQKEVGGRQIYWPRGRVLGGSSSLNAMMWVPGFPADYDEWAEHAGDAAHPIHGASRGAHRGPTDESSRVAERCHESLSMGERRRRTDVEFTRHRPAIARERLVLRRRRQRTVEVGNCGRGHKVGSRIGKRGIPFRVAAGVRIRHPPLGDDRPLIDALGEDMQAHAAGIVAQSLGEHGKPGTGAAEARQKCRVHIERPAAEVVEQRGRNDL